MAGLNPNPRLKKVTSSNQHSNAVALADSFDLAVTILLNRLYRLAPRTGQLFHVSIPIPAHDPLIWLKHNSHQHQNFWRNRDQTLTLAGIGHCLAFESDQGSQLAGVMEKVQNTLDQANSTGTDPQFIGGCGFDNQGSGLWKDTKSISFRLPRCFLKQDQQQYSLGFNLFAHSAKDWENQRQKLVQLLSSLSFTSSDLSTTKVKLLSRQDSFDYSRWSQAVEKTLGLIANNRIKKAVLARQASFTLSGELSATDTLGKLQAKQQGCFSFLLNLPNGTFLGCSPERLFSRRLSHLSTEAVAGTLPRGVSKEEDFHLERELLQDAKLRREHGYVTQFIFDQLKAYSQDVDTQFDTRVLKLPSVQHLSQHIQAALQSGVKNHDLVHALHPTPAVCGYPRSYSRQLITELEPTNRGWYSGIVGLVSKRKSEFSVAIRSALINEKQLHCFSGVGIVAGSEPMKEWQELEAKIQGFLNIFNENQV